MRFLRHEAGHAFNYAYRLYDRPDWRKAYDGWVALDKLEYVDRVMGEVAGDTPDAPSPTDDDIPVDAMRYSLEEHYRSAATAMPIRDSGIFDGGRATSHFRSFSIRRRKMRRWASRRNPSSTMSRNSSRR